MSDLDQVEYERGQAIGREVMEYHVSEMNALEAECLHWCPSMATLA